MTLALLIVAVILLTTFMFQTGFAMPAGALASDLTKKGDLARAVLLMLVLGPLAARGLAWALQLEPHAEVGLVLLSLVGVVPLAPRGARMAGGDVAFAVLITFVLGALAAVTAAPSARFLLGYDGPLELRTGTLLAEIALLQAGPLALGLFLRTKTKPGLAATLEKWVGRVNLGATVVVLGAILLVMLRTHALRAIGWKGALAAVAFSAIFAPLGYLLGGSDPTRRRTLAAIVNLPNVALALAIVTAAKAGTEFAVAVVGMFFVRAVVGVGMQKVVGSASARRSKHAVA